MRNLLVITFLSLTMSLSAATYYVATNGSDSNPGTLSQPWLTIQKGFSSISAGDILYIRGGTYTPTGTISGGQISGAVANGKKGTATNMYNVFAYPGEIPVLDCRNITNTSNGRVGIYLVNSDYWYIKGIEITRVDQNRSPVLRGQGLLIQSGNNNKIENVTAHHNGGPGLELRENCEGNLFLNCDAYSNYDPYSGTPGDDADGFDIGFIAARSGNDRVNTLIGCRSWLNSDDGYDMYQYPGYHGIYILKDCWAWKNGYKTDGVSQAGDGNGFKYGADNNYSLDATVRRTSTNCIAYANRQRGYSQEGANVKMLFYNNTAYQNGTWGFSFYDYDVADILRNNIAYKNPNGTIENQGSKRIHDHNSWDGKVTLSDADFASLDASQLSLPRKSDGSLPDMTFLHLSTGSDLIDAGVNVALPYNGSTPDMGAFELQSGAVDAAPVFTLATVENAAPSVIEMNYDLNLNSLVVPASSAFTVLVNSQARTLSSVSVSGKKVLLTLSADINYGDVITLAYNKPSNNPIQTSTGKAAATLSALSVTNNVLAQTPVFVSAAVQNSTPALVEMTYNISLADIVPAASSFKVLVNSTSRTVNSVTLSGTKVTLTLSSPVVYGNVITVSYTKPSSNQLQSDEGAQAAALSAQKVTNNVNATSLGYVSSVIENATPSRLEMTYNITLANIIPAASSFTVLVNSTERPVNSVTISGSKVLLTLSSPVVYGNVVTVSYTIPSVNQLQTSTGIQAETISDQAVTNNLAAPAPVYVSSVIENASPARLEITYNMTLANTVPSASAFRVRVNSVSRSITSVSVSGTKVILTISSAVANGNIVTVAYTKPSSNPLQSSSGSQVATIGSQAVTNNVNATLPIYTGSVIENATPSRIDMTYNTSLANTVPATTAFQVLVNSSTRTVSSVSVSGTKVLLTLSTPVAYGDAVTVSYTKPATKQLQTSSGAQAATLGAQTVTNNILAPVPLYISSIIETDTPDILEMTYDLPLADIVPSASAFKVLVNSSTRSVTSVTISGNKVVLTLSSPVIYGNSVTITYTKPASNQLQTNDGAQAATIKSQKVTNNIVSSTNTAPSVAITAPADNSSFSAPSDITITADASDAEGTITLVEFYNGTTRLGSKSSAPYLFTWSSVPQGTYSITVIATDNEGATTSSTITVTVVDMTPPPDNQLPAVAISSPTKGNKFEEPAEIEIEVAASDADGSVTKVTLFNGTEILAELTSPPYSYSWKDITAGTYQIRAIATDNLNATTTSTLVEFSVGHKPTYDPLSEIISLYPNPNNGQFTVEFLVPVKSDKSEVVISDLNGNVVHREKITPEVTSKEFNLTNVRTGLYILTVIDEGIIVTKKIIIK